ncbi:MULTISPECIES: head-tail adaptor protein [unclassified Gilliamella]|uniref:head-tail adaptor protein n=1 Tax=unclassified Gilliamella TaxID=2685620 RepID=UPI000A34213B|nr:MULTISPECIES: head-tail adaptor protein [unclassified Gilliamella]MCX8574524.1 head-tail adaptor protein [Gilliamella sp. B3831]MCX8576755.1 head-tail adaptor protein [Gilliamella sp. B3815]MCX8589263.1 head-tail adaptor protein [Gilliamella sp. B3812]MCX8603837.1 head-tail adaptor protein [Gilliamella sp. B3823]MCX8606717.1 head-tail adaptor protein [Gilliamella sp. B3825]
MIHSGELTKYILVRTREDIPVHAYDLQKTHVNRFHTFAKIVHSKSSTYLNSSQIDNTITHYVIIRRRDDKCLTTDNEIVFKNKIYRIKRVREIEESTSFLLIECEEIGADE